MQGLFMNKKITILALSASAALGLLNGCANIFDSSVGPEGYDVIVTDGKASVVETHKNTAKAAPQQKNENAALEQYSPSPYSGNLKSGQVMPYIPDSPVDNSKVTPFSDLNGNYAQSLENNKALETQSTPDAVKTEEVQAKEVIIEEASELPIYASSSNIASKCNLDNNKASNAARSMALSIAKKLSQTTGKIYVASTVIADEYSDCAQDVSGVVASALAGNGNFDVITANSQIGQNQGSSLLIPALIRQCKAQNIPYLNISVIQKVNGKPSVSVRVIRVHDGITLSQLSNSL